jgi:hypothetical protein
MSKVKKIKKVYVICQHSSFVKNTNLRFFVKMNFIIISEPNLNTILFKYLCKQYVIIFKKIIFLKKDPKLTE